MSICKKLTHLILAISSVNQSENKTTWLVIESNVQSDKNCNMDHTLCMSMFVHDKYCSI